MEGKGEQVGQSGWRGGWVRESEKVGEWVKVITAIYNDLSHEHRLFCVCRLSGDHDPHVTGKPHQHREQGVLL